jgi:hypothetical protein
MMAVFDVRLPHSRSVFAAASMAPGRSGVASFILDRQRDRQGRRLLQTFDDSIRSREIHGEPNFAGRVANRVGARNCVGDSYSQ